MKISLVEGVDFYYNPQGYIVLTESYHLSRGECCGNGCLHCPYDYDRVPTVRRDQLMKEKEFRNKESSNE